MENQVMCEWTLPNGSICGLQFNDIQTYSSHVKSHVVESSGARTCSWSGCDFPNTSVATFTQHVLFHPFHSYLKVLGSELQAKSNLPFCQMDEGFKNLVPPQCDELVCHWDDGKCNVVFESVGEFYSHVRSHVASMGIQSCQCKWKGTMCQLMCVCSIHHYSHVVYAVLEISWVYTCMLNGMS